MSLDELHTMTTGRARLAFEPLWRDIAYAIRTYQRAPGVAITAAITLGLAIGATTAIVSLLNALVLRQLPVKDPTSLVQVSTTTRLQGEAQLTYPQFRELAARQQVFSDVIGTWGNSSVVTVNDNGVVSKALVWAGTGNLHDALGLAPTAGRLLAERDMSLDGSAVEPVAVMGHGFWQRRYRGDPSVVGRTIRIENQPFTIVGVAPVGFTGFSIVTEPDLTIPLTAVPLLSGRSPSSFATSEARIVRMVGRLKSSVTLDQARAQLAAVWPSARDAAVPPTYSGDRRAELSIALRVESAATGTDTTLRRQYTRPLVILLGVATLVLLIACTTVAGLLLSRASARRHEIGMRLALGASRWGVARQLITEGVVLSLAGAAGGILLSYWACAAIVRVVFDEFLVPAVFNGAPDGRVVAWTTMAAVVAGVLCTLVPAWRGTRGTAVDALHADARTMSRSSHTGRLIVGTQLALSLVLLATAGVLIRSLSELHALDTGIERSDNVFVAYPEAARPGAYAKVDNDSYYLEVLRRVESVPGVTRASISLLKPGSGGGFRDAVVPIGTTADAAGVDATRSPVSPGFFGAVGLRIVKGRDFDWRDSSRNQGVTVLSESLARTLFGSSDPIGQHVRVGLDPSRNSLEVIGVVADARLYDLKDPDLMAAYTAALQDRNPSLKCFVIRADGLSSTALHTAVEQLGVERVGNIVTLQYITDRSLLLERLTASISTFFGVLVVLLAGVGVFGLMSQSVTQRRKEIGIRMAVGANPGRVVRDVVRDTLIVTLGGITVGLLGALAAVRLVETLLFGVTPQDPLTLSAAATSLIVTALLACTLPAIRASRTDPLIALRSD